MASRGCKKYAMFVCVRYFLFLSLILLPGLYSCDVLSSGEGAEEKNSDPQNVWVKNVELYFFTTSEADTTALGSAVVEMNNHSYQTSDDGLITIDSLKPKEYEARIYSENDTAEQSINIKDTLRYYEVEVKLNSSSSNRVIHDLQIIPYVIIEGDRVTFSDLEFTRTKFRGEYYYGDINIDSIDEGTYPISMKWRGFTESDTISINDDLKKVQFRTEFAKDVSLFVYDVIQGDTIPYNKGSISVQVSGNRDLNENGKHTEVYLEKRKSVVTINHPNTEQFEREVSISSNDSVRIKANPPFYRYFHIQLTTEIGEGSYRIPNAEVTFQGKEYITGDQSGDIRVNQKVSPGVHDLTIESPYVKSRTHKVVIANRDYINVRVESERADYWPLEVGNTYTYEKTGVWTDVGFTIAELDLKEEWKVVEKRIVDDATIFRVHVIQNGYKTDEEGGGPNDTTWIEDRVRHFKIIQKNDDNVIKVENKKYLDIEEYEDIARYQPLILGETITFGHFQSQSEDARRLKEGIGLIEAQEGGNLGNTKSTWNVTLELMDYNLK